MNTSQQLKILNACNLCGVKYNTTHQKTTVISEGENHTLLHIRCGNCGSRNIGFIQEEGMMGVTGIAAFVTDLGAEEVRLFLAKQPLTADNVLGCYKKLFRNN